MRYILFVFTSLIMFTGCMPKNYIIKDITALPQHPSFYTKDIKAFDENETAVFDNDFNQNYFKPWHIESLSFTKEESMWGFMYENKELYGQNYRLLTKQWYEKQRENSNFDDYAKVLKKAVTVRNTNLRVYPTNKPIFGDPKEAGEGFPFDYNQNSLVHINTPLLVSHYSLDKGWVFVESNIVMGWIDARDIAILDDKKAKEFENGIYGVALKDNFPLYDEKGIFIDYIKLGTLFPYHDGKFMIVNSLGEIKYIQNENILKKPLPFSAENIASVVKELENEPYGWGGLIDTRDCSAMTRDFFTPFGLYLKRNSSQQAKKGIYLDLKDMSKEEKKKFIIQNGIPFKSLLYAKGHIILYAGYIKGEPIIFHQFWGIRTKDLFDNEGRFIVGKSAFTTLEPGKEIDNFDENGALINKIIGLVQVTK